MTDQKSLNSTETELVDDVSEMLGRFRKGMAEGKISLHTPKVERVRQTMYLLADLMSGVEGDEGWKTVRIEEDEAGIAVVLKESFKLQ